MIDVTIEGRAVIKLDEEALRKTRNALHAFLSAADQLAGTERAKLVNGGHVDSLLALRLAIDNASATAVRRISG